jgi:hypothetical protein
MGIYSSPAPACALDGPILLTQAANEARQKLASWAQEQAVLSNDYMIDEDGHRIYRTASVQPWVEPLLREMELVVRHGGETCKPC